MNFRKFVKARRQQLGLSQRQLGKRIKFSRSGVANMENGYRPITPRTKQRLVQALR